MGRRIEALSVRQPSSLLGHESRNTVRESGLGMGMEIKFTVDSVEYSLPYNGGECPRLIQLPDGRVIRPENWLETFPPELGTFSIVAMAQAVKR